MTPVTDSRADLALLYRRAGFGATPAELDAAVAAGYQASLSKLLEPQSPDPGLAGLPDPVLTDPTRAFTTPPPPSEMEDLVGWWLTRMASARQPFAEKAALMWHGHFATSVVKVRVPKLMYDQNVLFRTQFNSDFHTLTLAVAHDPAMLIWLDAGKDHKADPNENFARELMELFTLGIGNYTEDDVRAGAKAFTGWRVGLDFAFRFVPADHDNSPVTFLGHTGPLTGEAVVDIVTHRPESARWVAAKVWSHLAYPVAPSDRVLDPLVAAYGPGLSLPALYRAVFTHPQFLSDATRTGLVKQPVEYVVGAVRALAPSLLAPGAPAAGVKAVTAALRSLGQVPFSPPDVGGWPQNGYWLTTASASARLAFATSLVSRADLSPVADAAPSDRVDAAAHLLGVQWTSGTAAALDQVRSDPAALTTLALVSPEYVLN